MMQAGKVQAGKVQAGKARVVTMAAVAALVSLLASGCTSVRNDLGTSSSVCYGALPAATTAVHGQGRLDGVRLVSVASLKGPAPHLYRAATSAGGGVSRVCLVAFSGSFRADEVVHPVGRERGHLAVVELVYPGDRLVATLLISRPPLHFGHSHIGVP